MRLPTSTALAVIVLLAGCATGPEPPRARNLLVVTLDTVRADHLGAYGYPRPTTPVLDTLATEATLFEDVTCSMPTTLPSHWTLFTGLPPNRHGILENGVLPPADQLALFDLLGEAGFRTAAVVAAKVLHEKFLRGLGLGEVFFGDGRDWREAMQLPAERVTTGATEWIEAHRGTPFALWVHYYDSHEPYTPPSETLAAFAGATPEELPPRLSTEWLGSLNEEGRGTALTPRERQHVVDLYDAELAHLDVQLGVLFDFLRTEGLWEDLLLLVVADHGQAHGESGFWGHGARLLEPVIKVPMLLKLPGQHRGTTVRAPVETLDILPTLADLLDIEPPTDLPGRSLLPALSGEPLPRRPFRLVFRRSYGAAPERRGLVLQGGDWKLTYYAEEGSTRRHLGRLDGPGGLDGANLYDAAAPEAALLERVLEDLDAGGETRSPEPGDLEMLRALGYVQ